MSVSYTQQELCVFSSLDIELPNEQARLDILKIHSSPITKHGEIGWYTNCIQVNFDAPFSKTWVLNNHLKNKIKGFFVVVSLSVCSKLVQHTKSSSINCLDIFDIFPDFEAIVKLSDGFNGADLRNVCTEAGNVLKPRILGTLTSLIRVFMLTLVFSGLFAIRSDREYVTQEDFMKAVRKVADSKKLESKLDYKPV